MPKITNPGIWVRLSARQWETVIALLSQEADGLEEDDNQFGGGSSVKKRVIWIREIVGEIESPLKRMGGKSDGD